MEDSQRELSLFLAMGRGDQSHPTTGTDNDFPVFSDRRMCLSPGWNTHFHCVWLVFTQHMYVCGTENGKIVVGAGSWDNINFKWQWDLFCIFMCHSIPCLVSQIPLHSFQVFRFSCCQVVRFDPWGMMNNSCFVVKVYRWKWQSFMSMLKSLFTVAASSPAPLTLEFIELVPS